MHRLALIITDDIFRGEERERQGWVWLTLKKTFSIKWRMKMKKSKKSIVITTAWLMQENDEWITGLASTQNKLEKKDEDLME